MSAEAARITCCRLEVDNRPARSGVPVVAVGGRDVLGGARRPARAGMAVTVLADGLRRSPSHAPLHGRADPRVVPRAVGPGAADDARPAPAEPALQPRSYVGLRRERRRAPA